MQILKIGIDVDDVLADFIPRFRFVAHELFGKPDLKTEPTDWAWTNFTLTKEQLTQVWAELRNTFEWHYHLPTLPNTSLVRDLERAGHELYFITARFVCKGRPPHIQTADWLRDYYDLQFPTVIVATNKAEIASALKLDYFIDDRTETCVAIQQAVPTCTVAVKDREHNRDCDPAIWRVKNFNEFAERILTGTEG